MRVLQIIKTNNGANWAFEQAKKLSVMGVEIICMIPDENGVMAEKYVANGMEVILFDASLPIKNPISFFSKKKEFMRLIEKVQPDIIHIHFVTNALFARLSLNNTEIPRIFQVPGPLHLEKKFYRKIDIYTSKKGMDYWIPTCKYSYNAYVKEGVDPQYLRLIYYGGYGGKEIYEYKENVNKLHQEFKINKNEKLIGMVSYFYKPSVLKGQKRGIKGHEDFFDAMEIIMKKYPNVTAIVIGGPWNNCIDYENKLKKYAKEKLGKKVAFTGFRTDLKDVYRELSIAVHPSHSENLGGAAESLAAGVPTISTNVGGFPDIVIDGETGYTVDKESPVQLAEAIDKMLSDYPRALKMAEKGRDKVRELLDIDNTSREVYKLYQHIMEKR